MNRSTDCSICLIHLDVKKALAKQSKNILRLFSILMLSVYPCPQCSRVYSHYTSRNRHIKYECGKLPTFNCIVTECGYKAKRRGHLRVHMKRRHNLEWYTMWKMIIVVANVLINSRICFISIKMVDGFHLSWEILLYILFIFWFCFESSSIYYLFMYLFLYFINLLQFSPIKTI